MNRDELRFEIFSSLKEVDEKFQAEHEELVSSFLDSFCKAYNAFEEIDESDIDKQFATVEMYIFNSLNNLLVSFSLLLSGFLVPSGNLMRNFGESIALSLLCSSYNLHYYKTISKTPTQYPYQKVLTYLLKNQNIKELNLVKAGVDKLACITRQYNNYSHASVFSMGSIFNFSKSGKVYLGAFYDHSKSKVYKKELRIRISACALIENVIPVPINNLRLTKKRQT